MMKPSSVTQFIKYDPKNNVKHFPECDDIKEINYYVSETKIGPLRKMVKIQNIHEQLLLIKKTRFAIL